MSIRVSELAKKLGIENADAKAYLEKIGSSVKSASQNIEDSVAEKVEKHFKGASIKSDVAPAPEKPAEKAPSKEQKDTAGQQPKDASPEKPADGRQKTKNADPAQKKEPAGDAPKKKRKFVTVINRQYLSGEQNRGQRHGGQRPGQDRGGAGGRRGANPNAPHGIIRPRRGSGPIRADGTRIGEPTLAELQEKERKEAARAASAAAENPVKAAPETPAEEKRESAAAARPAAPAGGASDQRKRSDRPQGNDRKNDRNDRGGRNDRPSRDGQKNNGFRKDAPAAKDNASDRRNSHGKNQKKNDRKDRNAWGDRNKERTVNLEKNGGRRQKPQQKPKETKEEEIKSIKVPDHITIRELAEKMKIEPSQIIKKLFMKGEMLTLNSDVDYDKAEEIALEFNILCEHEEKVDLIQDLLKDDEENPENMVPRPPVVCVMGHVDHGKTSLLDAIRDTKVTAREAGGITQKIGAYVVEAKGRKITFLDTPGHEAFTAMRMRGANSTDIAVLVVAADDGVMPQTVEAINHAKAAGVEIIVAVNKIDKPNANVDRVKQELSEYELIPEDWGGSTIFVPVSAKTHQGIDDLLDMILLTADVMELKADPKQKARGIVIEAQLDKGRGTVATVLVQKGTLHVGDPVSAGSSYGKVRAMTDENGRRVKSAGPSVPVEIQGLSEVPNAGEILIAHDSEKDARSFAQEFVTEEKSKLVQESRSRMSLDNLHNQIEAGNLKELDLIVKADVQGSVEAVKQSLEKLSNDEVVVKVIHGGVGAITESDVVLASASNAIIIGFNVRPDAVAKDMAETEHVDIHLYSVIYNAIEDVQDAMKGLLEPVYEEKITGHAEVRQTFKASGVGVIAGAFVTDGVVERISKIRLSRNGEQLFDGPIASLKRFKDDAKEVKQGFDCGIVLEGWQDVREGDLMEAYKMVEVPRE